MGYSSLEKDVRGNSPSPVVVCGRFKMLSLYRNAGNIISVSIGNYSHPTGLGPT